MPRLEARYGALKDAETGRVALAIFRRQVRLSSALAKEFHERIPKLFGEIVDLFERMGEVDRSINQINSTAPDGAHERLLSTELTARNRQGLGGSKSIVATTQLPDLSDPNKLLWPPPKPNVAAAMSFVPAFEKKFHRVGGKLMRKSISGAGNCKSNASNKRKKKKLQRNRITMPVLLDGRSNEFSWNLSFIS